MKMKVYHNRDGALVLTERTVNIKPNKSKIVSAAIWLFFLISLVGLSYMAILLYLIKLLILGGFYVN